MSGYSVTHNAQHINTTNHTFTSRTLTLIILTNFISNTVQVGNRAVNHTDHPRCSKFTHTHTHTHTYNSLLFNSKCCKVNSCANCSEETFLPRLPEVVQQRRLSTNSGTHSMTAVSKGHIAWGMSHPRHYTLLPLVKCTYNYILHYYIVPRTHRKLGERAFSVAAPKAWNRLPTKLKTSTCSTDSFKRSLKTFLFQSVYGCETRVS